MKKISREQKNIIKKLPFGIQEIGAVYDGIKNGVMDAFSTDLNEKEIKKNIEKLDLKCIIWNSTFLPYDNKRIAIARDKKVCKKIKKYRLDPDKWVLLGQMLGYPNCCIKHHSKVEKFNGRNKTSPFFRSNTRNIIQADYKLNTLFNFSSYDSSVKEDVMKSALSTRYAHKYYLIHIPCSLDCKKTKEQAGQIERMMQNYFPKENAKYKKLLKGGFIIFEPVNYAFFDYEKQGNQVKVKNLKFMPMVKQENVNKLKNIDYFNIEDGKIILPSRETIEPKKIAFFH